MIPDNITNILSKPAEWIDEEIATLRDFFNKDNRAITDGKSPLARMAVPI